MTCESRYVTHNNYTRQLISHPCNGAFQSPPVVGFPPEIDHCLQELPVGCRLAILSKYTNQSTASTDIVKNQVVVVDNIFEAVESGRQVFTRVPIVCV